MKLGNTIHQAVIKITSGRKGWDAFGMPVLKLTTIGRKSGLERTVMLTSPLQIDKGVVIVASKGGASTHPEWFLNLVENSQVIVETQSGRNEMTATVVDDESREQLWNTITKKFSNYGEYQNKTERVIPLVILS